MDRLLVVDDDVELCQLVSEYLHAEGFAVVAVHDGEKGVTQALSGEYGLVALDIMLPGMTGFEALRRIRVSAEVPVLMLTARGEDIDRIVGMEIGADDYLSKPFNPRELVARIRAILRRVQVLAEPGHNAPAQKLVVADVELDAAARSVKRGGDTITLTAVEFDLLAQLLNGAGRVLTREQLTRAVLGRELSTFDRSIDMHVSHLRRKLGQRPGGADRIMTMRGVGYIYTFSAR